jgi:hypothetical protein
VPATAGVRQARGEDDPRTETGQDGDSDDLAGPFVLPRVSHLDDNPKMNRLKSVLEDDSRA